jgi:hypothetical protein
VVYVSDRPNVAMRFCPLKFCLCHFASLLIEQMVFRIDWAEPFH